MKRGGTRSPDVAALMRATGVFAEMAEARKSGRFRHMRWPWQAATIIPRRNAPAFPSRRHVPEPRRAAQDNLTPPWRDDRTPVRYRRQFKPDELLKGAAIEVALFQSGSAERFQGFPLNGSEIEIDVCVHGASKLALSAHAIQIRREACATVMSREFDPAAQPTAESCACRDFRPPRGRSGPAACFPGRRSHLPELSVCRNQPMTADRPAPNHADP
jgi:hypothetical protein